MTDELAIQQNKPSAWPYALGGAAIGGVGGALAAGKGYGIPSKYSSYEDILAESEDTFKKQIEKGGENKGAWETAQSAAQKVKDAEAEYDRLVEEVKNSKSTEAIPEDAQVRKDLKTAQQNYDAALKAKQGSRGTSYKKVSSEIPAFNPEWKMGATDAAEYQRLFGEYTTAKSNYENLADITNLKTQIQDRKNSLQGTFDDFWTTAESKIKAERASKPFLGVGGPSYTSIEGFLKNKDSINALKKAIQDNHLYDNIEPTYSELITKGKVVPASTTAPKNYETHVVKNKNGKDVTILIKKSDYKELVKQREDNIFRMVKDQVEKYLETKNKLDKYESTFKPSDKGLVRSAGLTRDNAGKIVDLESNINTFRSELTQYNTDKKLLEELKVTNAVKEKGKKFSPEVEAILTRYGVETPKDAHALLNARISLVGQYDAGKKELEESLAKVLSKDKALAELEGQLGRLEASCPEAIELRRLEKKIRGQFREFMPKESVRSAAAGMTEEEAIRALEGSDVAKKLEAAKKALEEAAAKEGKALTPEQIAKALEEKGLTSKEAYVSKVKEAAKGEIEGVLGKLKHANKTWTGIAAAATLGLIGLGIGASRKEA